MSSQGLLTPEIIGSHAFMLALSGDAEAHGAMIAFETPVLAGRTAESGLIVETGGRAPMRIAAAYVINAAGLGASASRTTQLRAGAGFVMPFGPRLANQKIAVPHAAA